MTNILLISQFIFIIFLIITTHAKIYQPVVIGIFTQKYYGKDHKTKDDKHTVTYVDPRYINLAIMGGAKVVPIYSYSSKEFLTKQLNKVNGVIFQGGQGEFDMNDLWTKNARIVLDYAKNQNNQGRSFPILGISQGLQLFIYLTSSTKEQNFNEFKDKVQKWDTIKFQNDDYYLINGLSQESMKLLNRPVDKRQNGAAYFSYQKSFQLSKFEDDKSLTQFWNLIGTTEIGDNQFVSYLQAKKYPIYLVKFHPEYMSDRQFSPEHYIACLQILHKISENFMKKCLKSPHKYPSNQLKNQIIQSYSLSKSKEFLDLQIYIFIENSQQTYNGVNVHDDNIGKAVVGVVIILLLAFGFWGWTQMRRRHLSQHYSVGRQLSMYHFNQNNENRRQPETLNQNLLNANIRRQTNRL